MSSKKTDSVDWFSGLDFERDMPFTNEDLEAMARSRMLRPLSAAEYQRWADYLDPLVPRNNTDSDEPFEL